MSETWHADHSVIRDSRGREIASITDVQGTLTPVEYHRRASLLAAAPEMEEALRDVLPFCYEYREYGRVCLECLGRVRCAPDCVVGKAQAVLARLDEEPDHAK